MDTAIFHPFPRLPYELRVQIWALAARRRLVHIQASRVRMYSNARITYASSTAPPGVMHACHESCRHGPYQEAFFTALPGTSEAARYIWINFDEDIIDLADEHVHMLKPHAADIQRLRFPVPKGDDGDYFYSYFFHNSDKMVRDFTALRELHVAIHEHFLLWGTTCEASNYGACPRENVRFHDVHTWLLLTRHQIEMASNWSYEHGGRVLDMNTFDADMEWMLEADAGLHLSELAEID